MFLLAAVVPTFASGLKSLNADQIAALVQRAETAQPDEQCYLYAQVVSQLGNVADQQLASGDADHASQTLATIEKYSERMHQTLGPRNKKLKESEILVRETARRIDGMFHRAELEQQEMLRSTLHKLNALQSELMMNVFQK